jgi:hypothetical protein
MLPLKAPVNALHNAMGYPNGFIPPLPFLRGSLKHNHAALVLEELSDRLDVQTPPIRNFRGGVVLLGRKRRLNRVASGCRFGSHCLRYTSDRPVLLDTDTGSQTAALMSSPLPRGKGINLSPATPFVGGSQSRRASMDCRESKYGCSGSLALEVNLRAR